MLFYRFRSLSWLILCLLILFVCLSFLTWTRLSVGALCNLYIRQPVTIKSSMDNSRQASTRPTLTANQSSNGKTAGFNLRVELTNLSDVGTNKSQNSSRQQSLKDFLMRDLNITMLLEFIRNRPDCANVSTNPASYWRSQTFQNGKGSFSAEQDAQRMTKALLCGMLDWEYLTTPPLSELYPFEAFYLSRPPVLDDLDASNEKQSIVTMLSPSKKINLSETVKLRIDARDGRGAPKGFGGDEIRVWFTDAKLENTAVTAKVEDLGNGSYLASAPVPWVGSYSVNAAVTYSREYLRALIYLQLVLKSFRHVAALFQNENASELTPCYHTRVVPGHEESQLCDMTSSNGSPWFCGRPTKSELDCERDFAGSRVISEPLNTPATPAEVKLFQRSSGRESKVFRFIPNAIQFTVVPDSIEKEYIQPSPVCSKIPISDTWDFESPTGFLYNNVWMPRYCQIPDWDTSSFPRDLEVVLLGDSNGRGHYHRFFKLSGCTELIKSLTEKWHKPLLCRHSGNNFTVRWEPHTQPFMNGIEIAEKGSLIPSSNEIDRIPSYGNYLIVLNHFFHVTTAHISSLEFMFKSMKDAVVRLIKRNPNAVVVLQGPHTSQVGWPNHHEAGDMLGHEIIRMQREIFREIRHKVLFLNVRDMTVASSSMDFHPVVANQIFDTLLGFVNGRWDSH